MLCRQLSTACTGSETRTAQLTDTAALALLTVQMGSACRAPRRCKTLQQHKPLQQPPPLD